VLFPGLSRTTAETARSLDRRFDETRRLFMPNRAIRAGGPQRRPCPQPAFCGWY
jgi:hypothetical protein